MTVRRSDRLFFFSIALCLCYNFILYYINTTEKCFRKYRARRGNSDCRKSTVNLVFISLRCALDSCSQFVWVTNIKNRSNGYTHLTLVYIHLDESCLIIASGGVFGTQIAKATVRTAIVKQLLSQ